MKRQLPVPPPAIATGRARRPGAPRTTASARRRAYGLRLAAAPFAFPLLQALVRGAAGDVVALVGAGALLLWAGRAVDRGLLAGEGEPEPVRIAGLAVPPRLAGALATGLAALLISVGAAHDGHLMALVFGALGFAGCALAYGLEPMPDRGRLVEAARRATSRPEPAPRAASTVDPILAEARRKIADIEAAAASLHSRELTSRLAQIVARARRVLDLVERKPGDLSRARRFLATYLDGTRDVVGRYAARQHDLADTPLAENFRRVLTTVEEVFAEQEEVLRRDEELDLEVKIEVLETAGLRREGVH